jgi:hypothetical protein
MEGNNEIRLCKADMIRAVEYWLNEVLLRDEVQVVDVKELTNDSVFSIRVKTPERTWAKKEGSES